MCRFNSGFVVLVSIGRRLQDPLVELVKIEPKHLGIGMYQVQISRSLIFRVQQLSSDVGLKYGLSGDCVATN